MQVPDAHAELLVILRQVLGHSLGQRRHQHALAARGPQADLRQQVVDLSFDGPDLNRRIGQTRRPDDLLDDDALGFRQLVRPRRGGHEDHLADAGLPFFEVERPVVERRRQPEPVGHQHFLARSIAVVHAADLRHRLMALVDDEERVLRQVIEQRRRRLARGAAGQVPRIILDPVAVANLPNHLEVEHRPLVQPLRLEKLALRFQPRSVPRELLFDRLDSFLRPIARRDEVRFRIDGDLVVAAQRLARQRIERRELVHLVPEEPDPQPLLLVRQIDLDDVSAHAKRAATELGVVALVLNLHQLAEHLLAADPLPALERQQHAVIGFGRAEAVDARHAGDDDDIAALEQRPRRGQPHAVDFVVDRRFLLDVRVGRRHVGFGLVVVVVADEVLDGVLWKEPAEFLKELSRQRLVVHHHQRRAVDAGDGLRHRKRLARAGHAEQHLVRIASLQSLHELADGTRLIARQIELGHQGEAVVQRGHGNLRAYHRRYLRSTIDDCRSTIGNRASEIGDRKQASIADRQS